MAVTINWDKHDNPQKTVFKSLLKNGDFLDVTIACDDDQIQAHKVILSSASSFFRQILKRNPHSHPLLYIKGSKKKDLSYLLDYIYSGEAKVAQEDMESFMTLANSLKIQGLSEYAVDSEYISNIVEERKENIHDISSRGKKSNMKSRLSQDPSILPERMKTSTNDRNKIITGISFKCKFCGKGFKTNTVLKEHRSQCSSIQHEISNNMESELCGESEQLENMSELNEIHEQDMKILNKSNTILETVDGPSDDGLNTSLTEYQERITALVEKHDSGWTCKVCPYASLSRCHTREHVQIHIPGFSFKCENCSSTFKRLTSMRQHKPRCPNLQLNDEDHKNSDPLSFINQ